MKFLVSTRKNSPFQRQLIRVQDKITGALCCRRRQQALQQKPVGVQQAPFKVKKQVQFRYTDLKKQSRSRDLVQQLRMNRLHQSQVQLNEKDSDSSQQSSISMEDFDQDKTSDQFKQIQKEHPQCSKAVILKDLQLKRKHEQLMSLVKETSSFDEAANDPSSLQASFKKFICPLCLKLIYTCKTTLCGHSYCEVCLDEYLIYKKTCFVCDFDGSKGVEIRNKPLTSCFAIDNLIQQVASSEPNHNLVALDIEPHSQWANQEMHHKKWLKNKILPNDISVGAKVDIRESNYVWCVGTIKLVIESSGRETLLVVQYDDLPEAHDEVIYKNSPRLAQYGVYTQRKDIPKISTGFDENKDHSVINQLPSNYESKDSLIVFKKSDEKSADTQDLTRKASETQVQEFFDQFEETNIEQDRIQRWAESQTQQYEPILMRRVIEMITQRPQSSQLSGAQMIDQVMGERNRRPSPQRDLRNERRTILQGQVDRDFEILTDSRPLLSMLDSLVNLGERSHRLGRTRNVQLNVNAPPFQVPGAARETQVRNPFVEANARRQL